MSTGFGQQLFRQIEFLGAFVATVRGSVGA
jgi:hypothetical protein